METIHLKSVDPISQELLRSASRQGIELPWERFEKLQPQDGFLRLGLSCPYGCMQGPCRIDPLGRGPGKGACGLAPEEMVAGMLLRLCLQGTMEAWAAAQSERGASDISFSDILGELVGQALPKNDQADLSIDDILKSNALLRRPSSSHEELLSQSLRLSLLALGFQEQSGLATTTDSIPCTVGYGTVANQSIRIGLSGKPSAALVAALDKAVSEKPDSPAILVSLGDWIVLKDRFIPIACTSGESELLVSSGVIHLLVAGSDTDPGLKHLCETMNIPVVADDNGADAGDILQRARRHLESNSQLDLFSDAPPFQEHQILMSELNIAQLIGQDAAPQIALIGGSDTHQLSLGHLPVELATELCGKGLQVAAWGDAALWLLKAGSSSQEGNPPLPLENRQGPLLAVKALAAAGQLERLQGICFTGMMSCLELAAALGLAYLGCRVSVATPIPILGSRTVTDTLSDILQQNGGQLLHFDHPAQTRELSEWFVNS